MKDERGQIDVTCGVRIAMRDGLTLGATVYRRRGVESAPAVFTLTPYTSDRYHARGAYLARAGFASVLVDVRGRGNSEGLFRPHAHEAHDGHDVVEWLAQQEWCNGKVGMWGGSYAGYAQWATAKARPKHLQTIVPVAAAYPGVDFPFWRNIPYCYNIRWAMLTSGSTTNENLFGDSKYWDEFFQRCYIEHRRFADLAQMTGNASTLFDEWVRHPEPDSHWDAFTLDDDEWARIQLPVLSITGHYDGDQPGALEFYKRHMRLASSEIRQRHYLVIGPWDHAGTMKPASKMGGLTLPDNAMLDMNELHVEWFNWTLRGGVRPELLEKRVVCYCSGVDEWCYSDDFEAVADQWTRFYLEASASSPHDVFHSGRLTRVAPSAHDGLPDVYSYDPLDTEPGKVEMRSTEDDLTDQRTVLRLSANGLIYHSAPLDEPLVLGGFAKVVAWIAMDVPDTDFEVTLYEVIEDGRSIRLTRDRMRARYRHGLRVPVLVTPGRIEKYVFDGFFFVFRRVEVGSRLRLVLRAINSIHLQKNYNSGNEVAFESAQNARTARVQLFHDVVHATYLDLPIASPARVTSMMATRAEALDHVRASRP